MDYPYTWSLSTGKSYELVWDTYIGAPLILLLHAFPCLLKSHSKCVRLPSSYCLQVKNLHLSSVTVTSSLNKPFNLALGWMCASSSSTITNWRPYPSTELVANSTLTLFGTWYRQATLSSLSFHSDREMLDPLNLGTSVSAAPSSAMVVSVPPSVAATEWDISCQHFYKTKSFKSRGPSSLQIVMQCREIELPLKWN